LSAPVRLPGPLGLLAVSLVSHSPECSYGVPNTSPPRARWWLKTADSSSLVRGGLDSRGRRLRQGAYSQSAWAVFGCNCTRCNAEVAVRLDGLNAEIDKHFNAMTAKAGGK
jgi:hypothetical protein